MAKGRTSMILVVGLAVLGVSLMQKLTFVPPPPPGKHRLPVPVATVAGGAALFGAVPSAHADVGKASEALATASYPLISQIDWSKSPVLSKWLTGAAATWNPQKVATALEKTLDMGLQMDPALVQASVKAHEKAVAAAAASPTLVTSQADHKAVTESIAKLMASVPDTKTKAVFDAWADAGFIGDNSLNAAWYASLSQPKDALATFQAFLALQSEVAATAGRKASAAVGAYTPDYSDKLGGAAKDLADAVYPLFKTIDWTSTPVLAKWFADKSGTWDAKALATAADATLKLSLDLEPKLISNAVLAHDQAVGAAKYQAGLVTSQAQNEAVFESIARMFASAPPAEVKAVFDTAAEVGVKDLNGAWLASLDAEQAQAAFTAFQTLAAEVGKR